MSGDVDFMDDAGGSADVTDPEEYAPQPRTLPGTPALRRAVAAVVTVAAAVLVLVVNRPAHPAASHAQPGPGTAVMGPVGVPRPSLTTPARTPELTTSQLVHQLLGVPPCPWADDGQSFCSTYFVLPSDALAAVRRYFPGVRAVTDVTHVLRDTGPGSTHGLWTRSISARVGPQRLTVTVRTNESPPLGSGVLVAGGQRYAYCEQRLGKFLVAVVLASDPSDSGVLAGSVASDRVSALAGDARLLHL